MKLYIKNMVCHRCRLVMRSELEQLGNHPMSVELGEVEVMEDLSYRDQEKIRAAIGKLGFELIDDRRKIMIEKIDKTIINMIHDCDEASNLKQSEVIAQALNQDYTYLSKLFSEIEGITIEQFIIRQRSRQNTAPHMDINASGDGEEGRIRAAERN